VLNWTKLSLLLLSAPAFAAPLTLNSKSFKNEGEIPERFTCKGENISPQLSWSGAPKGTKSFVIIAFDGAEPEKATTHWVVYNLPREARSLGEGTNSLPPGAAQGLNEEKERKYMGPCAGDGERRYQFKIFALDNQTRFFVPPTRQDLEKAMEGHILAQSELIGLYAKTKSQE
jgi:Raf kinase inhibitor-like YbhB/YbcL family protein